MRTVSSAYFVVFFVSAVLRWSNLHAATALVETVTSKGEGKDRSSAIQEALVEAVSKVSGSTFDAASASQIVALEISATGRKNSFESAESYKSEVKKRSKGLIDQWEIVKDEVVAGRHKVELTVTVVKLVGAGVHETRKTISILPIRVLGEPNFFGQAVPAAGLGKSLRESLVSLLTSSRKFAVIDETFTDDVLAAASKAEVTETAVQAALRQANKLGAEFLVTGMAEGVRVYDESVTVGNTTAQIRRAAGVIRVRVILVSSGQTVLAVESEIEKIPDISFFGTQVDQSLTSASARFFSGRILDTIYPIRVTAVSESGEIIIDRGGESLLVGNRFSLFKSGKALEDSATGEKLGREETKVGEIEIVRVLPKVSYCKLISAPIDIEAGAICRLIESKSKRAGAETKPPANAVDDLFK